MRMSKTPIPHIIALSAGFVAWRTIGGIGGMLVAVILVIPIMEGIFAAIGWALSGGAKDTQPEQAVDAKADETKSEKPPME